MTFERRLPPLYVVQRRHVDAALHGVPDDKGVIVTLLIHRATQGIGKHCFRRLEHVSRILTWGPEPHDVGVPPTVSAAELGALITKLGAYEPDLVDNIRSFVTHMGNDDDRMHCVGDGAFESSNLAQVVLPQSITRIGNDAFSKCGWLSAVTLPDSLTHLGDGAFWRCQNLQKVVLPQSITHVGVGAFVGCRSLTLAPLPNSLTHIGAEAFCACASLKTITLPNSLTHVGDNVFRE